MPKIEDIHNLPGTISIAEYVVNIQKFIVRDIVVLGMKDNDSVIITFSRRSIAKLEIVNHFALVTLEVWK